MVRDISCLWRGAVCTLNQVYLNTAQGRQKALDRARSHYSDIPYEAGSPCGSARRSSWGILDLLSPFITVAGSPGVLSVRHEPFGIRTPLKPPPDPLGVA